MSMVKVLFLAPGDVFSFSGGGLDGLREVVRRMEGDFLGCDGFILASVKWRPKGKFLVHRSVHPALLGENPPRLKVEGDVQLAEAIVKSADASGLWVEATEAWGLDPGHWQIFSLMETLQTKSLRVVPISLSQMSPEAHRKWGVAVRRAVQKESGVLGILVSGSLSLPLDERASLLARKFDEAVLKIFSEGPLGALDEVDRELFQAAQPEGGWGSLYFLWGVLGDKALGKVEFYSRVSPGVGCALLSF
jgi:aromatic ring-opening dioxygenase catalytic subunit (LigB family)